MADQKSEKAPPAAIDEAALDQVSGGLPAVQKVREAAARLKTTQATPQLTSD